ncbi:MAG TPA: calcium/proton exchanger [Myxococcales bacterium]|nr:calcium/proton exchanger [Myxococcales bacterium]
MAAWIWRALWLLVPAAWLARGNSTLAFVLACAALIPLARSMGDATEALAGRLGPAAGSLLNASFGNAAELILGIAALKAGHVDLVKGSLTGSIIGNLLLVAGASIVTGGVRHQRLKFNKLAASSSIATLFLAVVALAVPTLLGARGKPPVLSQAISGILIVMYVLSLVFTLGTHRKELAAHEEPEGESHKGGLAQQIGKLVLSAAATAVASEVLVGSLEGALATLHLPEIFVGIVVVAVVGNAAEHAAALRFAARGEMDVALGIAWESSKQIALFAAPVLVFVGIALGAPMDLAFTRFEVIAVGLSVIALALIALDGETHWLEGAFLLATYAVLAVGFYFAG